MNENHRVGHRCLHLPRMARLTVPATPSKLGNSVAMSLAAARDALREDGQEQTERRVAENNFAADDDFARERRRTHITKAQRRIGDDREVIGREPSVGSVLVVEHVRKDSINPAIKPRQSERNRRDAEQAAPVIDQPPGPEQSHAAGALQVSLQGVEKVLISSRAFEERIAKARTETTNAPVTPAHG